MSIKEFRQELSKGLPLPAYILYSPEDFLLYEALSAIKEQFDAPGIFNFDVYDIKSSEDAAPMAQIIDVLNTLPFLSDRRLVVIKNIRKAAKNDVKKLEDYMKDPSPASLLVMLHEGSPQKIFDTSVFKNLKAVALTVNEREIPLWVKADAKKKGIDISGRAVEYLISIAGTDLGMLHSEIEKLSCLNISGQVDIDDIRGLVYSGADYNAFDLIEALMQGNAGEVFGIMEKSAGNQDPQMLLGALNYQYSRRYAGQYPRSSSPHKSSAKVFEIFALLHEADAAIKTSRKYVIEELLAKLLRIESRGGVN